MQLAEGGARVQLRKALRSTARVLAACGSALPLALSVVLYVAEAALSKPGGSLEELAQLASDWCRGRQLGRACARKSAAAGGAQCCRRRRRQQRQ